MYRYISNKTSYWFNLLSDTQTGKLGRQLSDHNVSGNKRFSIFFCKQTNKIHKFDGCFDPGRPGWVSSNGYKVLNFIGPFAKKLENLLSSENVVIGQSSSKCPVRVKLFLSNLVVQNQDFWSKKFSSKLETQKQLGI